jgi:hypothetical protein
VICGAGCAPQPARGRALRMSETAALPIASQAVIDRFIDALWIEDGLATLTLAAYRRDLGLLRRLAAWPASRKALDADARIRPAGLHGGTPRRHPRHHGQPAADGLQALLSLGRA